MCYIDIIEHALKLNNIAFLRLDGKMTHEQRQENIHKFEIDPQVSVFLLSLKAGGVGLNLISASRVYMVSKRRRRR